jgi:hypothetical protein
MNKEEENMKLDWAIDAKGESLIAFGDDVTWYIVDLTPSIFTSEEIWGLYSKDSDGNMKQLEFFWTRNKAKIAAQEMENEYGRHNP